MMVMVDYCSYSNKLPAATMSESHVDANESQPVVNDSDTGDGDANGRYDNGND
jgi:hypothetical protein